MPPRNALIDFGTREFICRSCPLSLQRPIRPPPRWTALPTSPRRLLAWHSSIAAPARTKSTTTATSTTSAIDDQDEDRRKLMETLGLLDDGKDVSVNYFEQEKDGEIRRLDSAEAFGHSLQGDSVGGAGKLPVDSIMEQLEEASHLLNLLEQVGGKDQVTKIKKRLASDLIDADEDRNETNLESLGTGTESIMISEEGWAGTGGQKIQHLNRKLKRIAVRITRHDGEILDHQRSSLWKAYMDTRKVLVSRHNVVQSATWDLLWRALGSDVESNQNRMAHIAVLARDMQISGATLHDEQQLLAIEAMFIDGHEMEAFDNHRRLVTTLGAKTETALEFWLLGLRMHCLQGDIERAERIIETIAELPGNKDPRFLLPFIRACAESSSSVEMGYKAYQRLRDMLGEEMTIEDYDQITSYFLTTNEADYALCIFVDMMSAGSISVKGTGRLPSTVANPFFFGKWVKRLIGLGEVEHAYKVFILMKNKGVVPRPMQVNGLLGAWLRSDSGDFMSQADAVAWEMINSRVQFVQRRKQAANFSSNIHLITTGIGWPSATLETFSLLAESYSQRGLHGRMEDLWRAFRQAEIAPDAFFMNQLLFSYIKNGQGRVVMDVYHALADEHGIKPDLVTFRALWMAITANRQYTIRKPEYQQHIPEVRALFAEMIRSVSVFQGQEFDYQLARKILHTFRKLDDKVGLLQAVRSLRKVFGFYPPEPLVLEILADTVDLERMSKSPSARKGLLLHTQSMNRFLEGRRKALENTIDLEPGVQVIGDWKGQVLYEFLVGKLKTSCKTSALYPSGVKHALKEAAEQMGLVDDATS